jgi:CRISPR-associated protein Cas1
MASRAKVKKIELDGYGSYLGMERGCFVVRDRYGNVRRYPLFEEEIGEVVLKPGNFVSVGALASLGFWEIDCLILTRKGKPVAVLRSLEDYSHVKTRVAQYEALKNGKGVEIAKQIVLAKINGQNQILEKYGLQPHNLAIVEEQINEIDSEDLTLVRRKLLPIEGRFTGRYFDQIFQLLPIKPESRKTFKAYDGMNNTFNLAYTLLKWKVYQAVLKAKLEPYLGFLHSEQFGKPSLVCDLTELYRYLVDDFLIQYCRKLRRKDFVMKHESVSKKRKGQREYLNDSMTKDLMRSFYDYLEGKVEVPRIRYGSRQTLETLINEEALLLAKYLRGERKTWIPRIARVKHQRINMGKDRGSNGDKGGADKAGAVFEG